MNATAAPPAPIPFTAASAPPVSRLIEPGRTDRRCCRLTPRPPLQGSVLSPWHSAIANARLCAKRERYAPGHCEAPWIKSKALHLFWRKASPLLRTARHGKHSEPNTGRPDHERDPES